MSPSEVRTWAWPSSVCLIVCFMQKRKVKCDGEKRRQTNWGSKTRTNIRASRTIPKVLTRADPQHHERGHTAAVRKLQRSIAASSTFTFSSAKPPSYNYTPDWKSASQCFCITGMTLRRGARWLSWQQDWRVIVAVERDVCSLTVDLRARPLSSGMFVGGADGVSDCRQRLKQREWSRQRCSDKEAAPDNGSSSRQDKWHKC